MNKVLLTDAVPDIEKYWDYEANEGKKPSDFGASSSEKSGQNVLYAELR